MSDPIQRGTADDSHTAGNDDGGNPPPADEDTPDGQFDDQDMPTTDGEPAERDAHPEPPDSTHSEPPD